MARLDDANRSYYYFRALSLVCQSRIYEFDNAYTMMRVPAVLREIAFLITAGSDLSTIVGILLRSIPLSATMSIRSYPPAAESSDPNRSIHSLTVISLNSLAFLFLVGSES